MKLVFNFLLLHICWPSLTFQIYVRNILKKISCLCFSSQDERSRICEFYKRRGLDIPKPGLFNAITLLMNSMNICILVFEMLRNIKI